jgi:hypothetical protein
MFWLGSLSPAIISPAVVSPAFGKRRNKFLLLNAHQDKQQKTFDPLIKHKRKSVD